MLRFGTTTCTLVLWCCWTTPDANPLSKPPPRTAGCRPGPAMHHTGDIHNALGSLHSWLRKIRYSAGIDEERCVTHVTLANFCVVCPMGGAHVYFMASLTSLCPSESVWPLVHAQVLMPAALGQTDATCARVEQDCSGVLCGCQTCWRAVKCPSPQQKPQQW